MTIYTTSNDRKFLSMLFSLEETERVHTINALIDHLDALDMLTEDLEDDDPAGGNADDVGEMQEYFNTQPCYGVDQRLGPTNNRAARQAHFIDTGVMA